MDETLTGETPTWVIILIPFAFLIVFPVFWCFVIWINSHVGGWSRLAKQYRSDEPDPEGKQWHSLQGGVGCVYYRGVLDAVTTKKGIYLQPNVLFRFAHPRLFIPWDDFHKVKHFSILWASRVRSTIGNPGIARLSLPARVFEESEGRSLLERGS